MEEYLKIQASKSAIQKHEENIKKVQQGVPQRIKTKPAFKEEHESFMDSDFYSSEEEEEREIEDRPRARETEVIVIEDLTSSSSSSSSSSSEGEESSDGEPNEEPNKEKEKEKEVIEIDDSDTSSSEGEESSEEEEPHKKEGEEPSDEDNDDDDFDLTSPTPGSLLLIRKEASDAFVPAIVVERNNKKLTVRMPDQRIVPVRASQVIDKTDPSFFRVSIEDPGTDIEADFGAIQGRLQSIFIGETKTLRSRLFGKRHSQQSGRLLRELIVMGLGEKERERLVELVVSRFGSEENFSFAMDVLVPEATLIIIQRRYGVNADLAEIMGKSVSFFPYCKLEMLQSENAERELALKKAQPKAPRKKSAMKITRLKSGPQVPKNQESKDKRKVTELSSDSEGEIGPGESSIRQDPRKKRSQPTAAKWKLREYTLDESTSESSGSGSNSDSGSGSSEESEESE